MELFVKQIRKKHVDTKYKSYTPPLAGKKLGSTQQKRYIFGDNADNKKGSPDKSGLP
jgi:hypothetical protein